MLDLQLSIIKPGNPLAVQMHFKPSNQAVPLSSLSHHCPAVHASWPSARVARFKLLCSCDYYFLIAYRKFRNDLLLGAPEHTWLRSHPDRITHRCSQFSAPVKRKSSWLVLPFEQVLYDPFLDSWLDESASFFKASGLADFAPRVAWAKGYANIASLVSRNYFTTARVG